MSKIAVIIRTIRNAIFAFVMLYLPCPAREAEDHGHEENRVARQAEVYGTAAMSAATDGGGGSALSEDYSQTPIWRTAPVGGPDWMYYAWRPLPMPAADEVLAFPSMVTVAGAF
jgi:hypothetical protein